MRGKCILLLSALVSACGTYNAADTMASRNDFTTDMARCGAGLGIDNKVGLIIKGETQKSGGELSAQQSSEIRARAVTEGLMSSDGKNYDAYLKCILELDKRRGDRKTLELIERTQQPALKVYFAHPNQKSNDRFARRLIIENTGEDLTELEVMPAPFLFITDLCVIRKPSDCEDEAAHRASKMAFIPVENYFSPVTHHGRYKGELYSVDEAASSILSDVAEKFIRSAQSDRTSSMTKYVITLVKVKYRDKFMNLHERFIDVSIEQRELPTALGQALFALRAEWIRSNMAINAHRASVSALTQVWANTSRSRTDLPTPWQQYRSTRG